MSDFVSFQFFGFILVKKLRNSDFESHSITLRYFDKKKYMLSGLNVSDGKMSDFVSFPLSRITLSINLRNFHLKGH